MSGTGRHDRSRSAIWQPFPLTEPGRDRVRSLYFTAAESGMTRAQLRHGESTGRWIRLGRGSYRLGGEPATELDRCLGPVAATSGVACGRLAGVLLGLDSVALDGPELSRDVGSSNARAGVRRRSLLGDPVLIGGFACTSGLQTLIDLAAVLDDDAWEQALESALRKRLFCIGELEAIVPELGRRRTPGVNRIRRVLKLRPAGVAPTGSLLETLFVQLRRRVPGSTEPLRQVEVRNAHGEIVAFVDFAWPELGLFIELDGEHHLGQPVHDARRETAVVAATGWLVGRFTWTELVRYPESTARRLAELLERASARPVR
jgi:very-short-patch-repair endonuclease